MPTRQRKTKFRKAYERQQVKLQKALRRYRIGPSVPDEPAAPWFTAFEYKFPADFPRAEQEAVEAALKKANQSFSNQRLTAGSYDEYRAAYDKWFKEIVEAYAQAIRRVAGSLPSEQWSPMGRVDELQRYAKAAASLVHLAGVFDSEWWTSLRAQVREPACEDQRPNARSPEQAARARERRGVVMPILEKRKEKNRTWSANTLANDAGVSPTCVYEYLDGKRRLTDPNRNAIADALGIKPEELPN